MVMDAVVREAGQEVEKRDVSGSSGAKDVDR